MLLGLLLHYHDVNVAGNGEIACVRKGILKVSGDDIGWVSYYFAMITS